VSSLDGDQERGVGLPSWVPEGIDVTVPSVARAYDFMLGGYHNFAVDREYAERTEKILPGATQGGFANRAFLGRAVRWLVGAGIRQFLDIGSGIPTMGNVHEIAQEAAPEARVMYVDIDPVAVAHTRAILAGNPLAGVLRADLRRPMDIVDHPDVRDLLNFSEPIAVVLSAVLHAVVDADDPYRIVAQLRDAVVADSYIVISHVTWIAEMAEAFENIQQLAKRTSTPGQFRSPEEVARLFTGLDVVEPGIVPVTDWHPDPDASTHKNWPGLIGGIGRKP
jgi:S-adenosyl methyltransferase